MFSIDYYGKVRKLTKILRVKCVILDLRCSPPRVLNNPKIIGFYCLRPVNVNYVFLIDSVQSQLFSLKSLYLIVGAAKLDVLCDI